MRAISSQFHIFWRGKDISHRIDTLNPYTSTSVKSTSAGCIDIAAALPIDKEYMSEYKQYAQKKTFQVPF
jgi:hypothetical protein